VRRWRETLTGLGLWLIGVVRSGHHPTRSAVKACSQKLRGNKAMKTNHKLAVAVLAGVAIGHCRGHGDTRAASQDTTRLCCRGGRRHGPRHLSEICGEGPGNAGAFQRPLPASHRQDPSGGGRSAQAHRGDRVRQRGESTCMGGFAGLRGDQADPAKLCDEPHIHRRGPPSPVTAHFRPQI
jgi:hypothetical protein